MDPRKMVVCETGRLLGNGTFRLSPEDKEIQRFRSTRGGRRVLKKFRRALADMAREEMARNK